MSLALQLPGHHRPTILLSDRAEARAAGYERSNDHPILFCSKLENAREQLARRGVGTGAVQESGSVHFFEIRDPEGNSIEICAEP